MALTYVPLLLLLVRLTTSSGKGKVTVIIVAEEANGRQVSVAL